VFLLDPARLNWFVQAMFEYFRPRRVFLP